MRLALPAIAGLLLGATPGWAQQAGSPRNAPPHIGYVYPAGGRQGATFEITVGGQALGEPAEALVTGRGVTARFRTLERPLTQKAFQELRGAAETLQKRRREAGGHIGAEWTAEDEARLREVRQRMAVGPASRQANPAIAERAVIEITLAPDAAPGPHELRLKTPGGLSNPLVFEVGQSAEFSAPAARPEPTRRRDIAGARAATPSGPPLEVVLPAVVNGQILPGEVDHIRFNARQGQRVVVAVAARALIPYLADAVPGWFQATVTVRDSDGRQLAYADDFAFRPDPALMFEIPRDGDYVVEIADAIFRGREDFVYRVTIGEVPFITSIFPIGGPASHASEVAVEGWNLPSTKARIDSASHGPGEYRLALRRDGILSNDAPFEIGGGPEVDEVEDAAGAGQQAITTPITINGRIGVDGDMDVFKISGLAGERLVAEITARRLNSPLDSILQVTDSAGDLIAANDDSEDRGSGLTTHHADSRVVFEVPAEGACLVHVGDAQHRGGLDFAYRLHVGAPQPDFAVRIVPSSITVRGGGSAVVTAHVLRHDGFSGPVMLSLKNAPPGLVLTGGRVPGGQNSVRLTITAAPVFDDAVLPLRFEARADIDGHRIVHPATPADDMMQAFAYRHLVPAQTALIEVLARGGGGRTGVARDRAGAVAQIRAGGVGRVDVELPRMRGEGRLLFELSEPPEGLTLGGWRLGVGTVELSFQAETARPTVGQEGNLIVMAYIERSPSENGTAKKSDPRRLPLGPLPAIPFRIVAR